MARLETFPENKLTATTQEALQPYRLKNKISPVYLQMANSQPALQAYIAMENALLSSALSLLEIEAIKLLVSEINQCDFCLSVHNYKAGTAGLDEEQRRAVRRGEAIGQQRVDAIIMLVPVLLKTPGPLSDDQLDQLRDAGFSDQDLVDITMAISTIFFTNMFNHINKSDLPMPPAPEVY